MPKRKASDSGNGDSIKTEESNASRVTEDTGSENATSRIQTIQAGTNQNQTLLQTKDVPSANKRVKGEEDGGSSVKLEQKSTDNGDIPGDVKIFISPEGDRYIDLGKKKRATIRSFKGVPLVDIREFYGVDGQEKPGKKGISLTVEQWESLKGGTSVIDKLLEGLKKK